jgi:hypothetical protein
MCQSDSSLRGSDLSSVWESVVWVGTITSVKEPENPSMILLEEMDQLNVDNNRKFCLD